MARGGGASKGLTGEAESGAMASAKKGDLMRRAWWAVSCVAASPEPMFRVTMGDLRKLLMLESFNYDSMGDSCSNNSLNESDPPGRSVRFRRGFILTYVFPRRIVGARLSYFHDIGAVTSLHIDVA